MTGAGEPERFPHGTLPGGSVSRLRALNRPQRTEVSVDDGGVPSEVLLKGSWRRCARVEEVWRVEDGWWRPQPVRRTYFRLELEEGRLLTVYLDHLEASWWQQRY